MAKICEGKVIFVVNLSVKLVNFAITSVYIGSSSDKDFIKSRSVRMIINLMCTRTKLAKALFLISSSYIRRVFSVIHLPRTLLRRKRLFQSVRVKKAFFGYPFLLEQLFLLTIGLLLIHTSF